ncbi:MAG TPA: sigma-70 family RNA polymerase sigma factor [Clostridia bacterium]|nr:sigma-70 family RNA polymerase sigma factor [Clostridia bacterium]
MAIPPEPEEERYLGPGGSPGATAGLASPAMSNFHGSHNFSGANKKIICKFFAKKVVLDYRDRSKGVEFLEKYSDEVLVQKCLDGDRSAFEEIVRRYQKQIYSLAYRLTNHLEDAQDLAQEVFIKLYQVLEKYDAQRPFFPWMYKVATNVCYTSLRRRPANEVPLEKVIEFGPIVPQSQHQPEERYETKEVQLLVQQAIAELPEKYRIPLVLRYLEEFSYRQIAEAMDLPLTTIETRLYRGKALLQKRLDPILERGERHEMSRS